MNIIQIISHSPESCPLGNPKNLDLIMDWFEKVGSIAAKYDVKVIGVWTDRWGHTSWAIFEAPSMEKFFKFELEPVNVARVAFNSVETRMVTNAEESLSFFTQYKKLNK